MTTVEEHASHVERLLASAMNAAKQTDAVLLADALGRVTATAVLSPVDLPLFRNSQMDGYAVHSVDLAELPATLPVVGDIPAGPAGPLAFKRGTAVRIMTGAVVPDDADCVVPVEDTVLAGDGSVVISRGRAPGEFVRERASDLRAGDQLLPAGQLLGPRHVAALAAAGLATVSVRRKIRIAAISTGAELVEPGSIPLPGQIFDSNLVALVAAITEAGAEVTFARRSDDDPARFLALLHEAIAIADVVVTSGGISEGAYEVVREALEPLGASVGHVAMQPGGPQASALIDHVPVLSFPGNPVSTQISFAVFLRPLLLAAAGLRNGTVEHRALAIDVRSIAGKRQFLRGRANDDDTVEPVSGASSHLVGGMARAELLIDIPAEITELRTGDDVRVWWL